MSSSCYWIPKFAPTNLNRCSVDHVVFVATDAALAPETVSIKNVPFDSPSARPVRQSSGQTCEAPPQF
eukprot:297480-Amphidinium_carterae.1